MLSCALFIRYLSNKKKKLKTKFSYKPKILPVYLKALVLAQIFVVFCKSFRLI